MLFEGIFDLPFEIRIRLRQRFVHVDADDFLSILRQFARDVLQRNERANSMRNFPKSNGDAPGFRLTCFVTFAFEHAFSSGATMVIRSSTPYASAKLRTPGSPHSYPSATILWGSSRYNTLKR